jgi:hypothetical protein
VLAVNPHAHPVMFPALSDSSDQWRIGSRSRATALLLISEPCVFRNGYLYSSRIRGDHEQPFAFHAQLGIVVIHAGANDGQCQQQKYYNEWEHN